MIKLTLAVIATLAVANVPAFAAETCLTPGFVKMEGSNACHRDVAAYIRGTGMEDVPQLRNARIEQRVINGEIEDVVVVENAADALFNGLRTENSVSFPKF